jgi:hypothetical protein
MIAAAVVEKVRRMLNEGRISQRKIARQMGISRGTVNAIALGRHSDPSARRRWEDRGFIPPDGEPVRCPGCGGLVQMPCLLCYMRAKERDRLPRTISCRGSTRGTIATASRG